MEKVVSTELIPAHSNYLDDDQLEAREQLLEWGWDESKIEIILTKYWDDFPCFSCGDAVNDYLDWVSVEENW